MKVVIFCGGKGTRLSEQTEYRPKPMVEVGGRPILWHIMKHYASFGFKDFVLCLGYKQEYIRQYFLNYEYMNNDFTIHLNSHKKTLLHNKHAEDWTVTLIDTGPETPKGERLKLVEPFVDGDDFLLTYGDGVADVDLKALKAFHKAHGKIATFTGVHPVSRFAMVKADAKGMVSAWKEKQQIKEYVNAGYFVFKKGIFKYLDKSEELEEGPMERLTKAGQVTMFRHEGFWQCMDTIRDHQLLEGMWSSGKAPWKIW